MDDGVVSAEGSPDLTVNTELLHMLRIGTNCHFSCSINWEAAVEMDESHVKSETAT